MAELQDKLIFKSSSSTVYLLYIATNLTFSLGFELFYEGMLSCTNGSFTATNGTLFSVNYPTDYLTNQTCVTTIHMKDAYAIELTFDFFHTESEADFNLRNEMCTLDYVEISANNTTNRICGNWKGKEHLLFFKFTTSKFKLKFVSNEIITKQGFVMKWFSTPTTLSLNQTIPNTTSCVGPLLEANDSCYELISDAYPWEESHNICRERGAVLARVDDINDHEAIENMLLERSLEERTSFWIGANDRLFEGDYLWTDRSAVDFQNWFPGWLHSNDNGTRRNSQPSDDGFSNEDCVEMRRMYAYPEKGTGIAGSYFWNDRNCRERNPFICQYTKNIQKRSAERVPTYCDNVYNLTSDSPTVIVSSPGFPDKYPKLSSCHVIITAPFGTQIFLEFLHMKIEPGKGCEYDNVTISQFPRNLGSGSINTTDNATIHCGDWNRRLKLLRWTSDVNNAVIVFQSDNSKQFSGFQIQATIVNEDRRCGENPAAAPWIYGPGGCWYPTDKAANFSHATAFCESSGGMLTDITAEQIYFVGEMMHKNDDECADIWVISDTNITDTVTEDLESDGDANGCTSMTLCRKQSKSSILVEYDSIVSNVTCSDIKEFVCKKTASDKTTQVAYVNCSSETGDITYFCGQGQHYNNNMHVTYRFEAPVGHRVIVELYDYSLEYQDNCLYDYLDTSGMLIDQRYCGESSGTRTLISKTNSAEIQFRSDEDVAKCGFNFTWYWVKSNTAFEVKEKTSTGGDIQSLNFPKAFPDKIDDCYDIQSTNGHRVILEIITLELPEDGCLKIRLGIKTDSDVLRSYCGGTVLDDSSIFEGVVISYGQKMTLCLRVSGLQRNLGLNATYSFVPANTFTMTKLIFVEPNQTISSSSLMFPLPFPANFIHDVVFTTQIGYSISVKFTHMSASNTTDQCSSDALRVFDISLQHEVLTPLMDFSCDDGTDPMKSSGEVEFKSYLNTLRIILASGSYGNDKFSIKYKANISSKPDPQYLKKTISDAGSIDFCDNTTCKNGGKCTREHTGRFTCTCGLQYTGLFCQASQCDLKPCQHGSCNLTTVGFSCICQSGYWGPRCTMDTVRCRFMRCSGNGRCVLLNKTETGCLCDKDWMDSKCSKMIMQSEENLTIGEKLLKEPIWIGMIVILNMVFFFCVTYVIRRKCGKTIAKLIPKRKKATFSNDKEDSKTETSPSERNVYSLALEVPRVRDLSTYSPKSSFLICNHAEKTEKETSTPSTSVVDEQNSAAAVKMFASYNTKKGLMAPNFAALAAERKVMTSSVRGIMSCGIQGGTMSFSDGAYGDCDQLESPHGILRSYTINTGGDDYNRIKLKKEQPFRKVNTYSGSPGSPSIIVSKHFDSPNKNHETTEPEHYYPEIRILNVRNHEDSRNSDSDDSNVPSVNIKPYLPSDSLAVDDSQLTQGSENVDSGYPSTTISSNNTHSGTNVEDIKIFKLASPSAAERRKKFCSKSKSASFYNLSIGGPPYCSVDSGSSQTFHNGKRHRHTSKKQTEFSLDSGSFESDKCHSCKGETISRSAVTYDAELDKLFRSRDRFREYSGYVSCDYERHKRQRRRRHKCMCKQHYKYQSSREANRVYDHSQSRSNHENMSHNAYLTSRSSRHLSLSKIRDMRRSYHKTMSKMSSTESETCNCNERDRRRDINQSYRNKAYYPAHPAHAVHPYDKSKSWELCRDDSYKTKMMQSFLSDSCSADVINYDTNYQSISNDPSPPRAELAPVPSLSRSHESQSSYNSFLSYVSSHVDGRQNNCSASKGSDQKYSTEDEIMEISYLSDNNNYGNDTKNINATRTREYKRQYKQAINESITQVKDSAYQTKQSSVDKIGTSRKDDATDNTVKQRSNNLNSRSEDRVRRHLHQAAMKLAILKRFQAKEHYSKDSAIHTFSEDDLSAEDTEPRRQLVKRISANQGFQLPEMNLSQVKEEFSGLSRETDSYNTPTHETQTAEYGDTLTVDNTASLSLGKISDVQCGRSESPDIYLGRLSQHMSHHTSQHTSHNTSPGTVLNYNVHDSNDISIDMEDCNDTNKSVPSTNFQMTDLDNVHVHGMGINDEMLEKETHV